MSTFPSNTLPFWAVLSTLWSGHASHIFPFKQPYFYTHVESLWYPWNELYNLITMWKKKKVFLFFLPGYALFSIIERQQLIVPSSLSLFVTLQTCPQTFLSQIEWSWVCLISVNEGSISLFFWSPFSHSSSTVSFLMWKEPAACRTPGTYRDSQ